MALGIPAASIARRMKSHLRPTDSIRSTSGVGKRHGEGEAREPGARPNVGDPRGGPQLGDLEAGEAVGDVDLPGALVDHRADRGSLLGEQLEHDTKLPLGLPVERGRGVRAHSETSGATTTQRWGSSPSL